MKKKLVSKSKAKKVTTGGQGDEICFVISPIGKEGTKQHAQFKEVLDYVIKPAFEESDYKYAVVRADDINRTGSFIKDILENIYSSHIVVADLTNQNPNVFYELGVRHSLRPRTILISQNLDDIPSDLREYRTIIYDTSAKGAITFKKKIKEFIKEINKEPERLDNPVLDRLGSITENKLAQVESERDSLKIELSKILSGGKPTTSQTKTNNNANKRFDRILKLRNGEKQGMFDGGFNRGDEEYTLPYKQGNFNLYFLKEGKTITGFWYVSIHNNDADIAEELADVRVLLERCSKGQDVNCDFILVIGSDIPDKAQYNKMFNEMKKKLASANRKYFKFHLLDPSELEKWEKELGLRV